MTNARDKYPFGQAGTGQWRVMCAEIDHLRPSTTGPTAVFIPSHGGVQTSHIPAEWEAIRQTVNCPTCEGSRVTRTLDEFKANGMHCPDCTDGKIDMLRLLAVGAAAFNAEVGPDGRVLCLRPGNRRERAETLLHDLRAVQP